MILSKKIVLWDWAGTIFNENRRKPALKAMSMLDRFARNNAIQGVITNGAYYAVKEEMFENNLHQYFVHEGKLLLISPSEGYLPKPSPQMFIIMMSWINLDGEVLYIGDSDTDEIMAKNAKCDFINIDNL